MADWITTDEASELSGYHVVYLRELIRAKKIEAQKKGGSWWVKLDSLLAYVRKANASPDRRHGAKKASETGT
jgi:excisionase family DNA binding protein